MRIVWILLLVVLGALAVYLFTRFEGTPPIVQTRAVQTFVSKEHPHEFHVSDDGTGLASVRVWLSQGENEHELAAESYPGNLFTGADLLVERSLLATVDPTKLGLVDGEATLSIEARDFSWRGNVARVDVPLTIDTSPPRIALATGLTYVRRGGSEAVVYSVSEDARRHGVEVGEFSFPGFPHPADPSRRVALFALPPAAPADARPRVFAEDLAGNRAVIGVPVEVIDRAFPSDRISLTESFMQAKATELNVPVDAGLEQAYLKINGEMRRANDAKIREICSESSGDRLWTGAFVQMPNTHVGARFAETRSYDFGGRTIDTQVHLGYDLASTQQAPIPAANDGVVAFTGPLGIYGETVIVDHGLGLFSLYGHLSEIGVSKGQAVAKGAPLGRSGQTGLAGGDHLHYSVLLSGTFVDPLEWFDPKWIADHIEPDLAGPAPAATP
jgi:murein DD-endopeptidase MepM/ murein hydrolase activator NlpD